MPAPRVEALPSEISVWLTLRFSRPPAAFTVRQNERVVWAEVAAEGTRFERELAMALSDHAVELRVTADVPAGEGETALEVMVEADGRTRLARTLWVEGDVDEPLVFAWGAHE